MVIIFCFMSKSIFAWKIKEGVGDLVLVLLKRDHLSQSQMTQAKIDLTLLFEIVSIQSLFMSLTTCFTSPLSEKRSSETKNLDLFCFDSTLWQFLETMYNSLFLRQFGISINVFQWYEIIFYWVSRKNPGNYNSK